MKIRIDYSFYTDGDYGLRTPEKFGCSGREVKINDEYFDYVGMMTFENDESWRCKNDAESFLGKLLCEGIDISYTHYWLMKYFCTIIEELIDFIKENDCGALIKDISGNHDGTKIIVTFIDDHEISTTTNDKQTTTSTTTNDKQTTTSTSTNDKQTTTSTSTNDKQTTTSTSTNDKQTTTSSKKSEFANCHTCVCSTCAKDSWEGRGGRCSHCYLVGPSFNDESDFSKCHKSACEWWAPKSEHCTHCLCNVCTFGVFDCPSSKKNNTTTPCEGCITRDSESKSITNCESFMSHFLAHRTLSYTNYH